MRGTAGEYSKVAVCAELDFIGWAAARYDACRKWLDHRRSGCNFPGNTNYRQVATWVTKNRILYHEPTRCCIRRFPSIAEGLIALAPDS